MGIRVEQRETEIDNTQSSIRDLQIKPHKKQRKTIIAVGTPGSKLQMIYFNHVIYPE